MSSFVRAVISDRTNDNSDPKIIRRPIRVVLMGHLALSPFQ